MDELSALLRPYGVMLNVRAIRVRMDELGLSCEHEAALDLIRTQLRCLT